MKTFIYQSTNFQLLVSAKGKDDAVNKMKEILNVRAIDERFVFEGIFRATQL